MWYSPYISGLWLGRGEFHLHIVFQIIARDVLEYMYCGNMKVTAAVFCLGQTPLNSAKICLFYFICYLTMLQYYYAIATHSAVEVTKKIKISNFLLSDSSRQALVSI